jgi:hypothetical protein
LAQKNTWLAEGQATHLDLLDQHRRVLAELEQSNRWASKLDQDLLDYQARVAAVQDELEATTQAYEREIGRLKEHMEQQTSQLVRCVELLHQAEAQVEERTLWAQSLDTEVNQLRTLLQNTKHSRWVRLGRRLNVGPRLP